MHKHKSKMCKTKIVRTIAAPTGKTSKPSKPSKPSNCIAGQRLSNIWPTRRKHTLNTLAYQPVRPAASTAIKGRNMYYTRV